MVGERGVNNCWELYADCIIERVRRWTQWHYRCAVL